MRLYTYLKSFSLTKNKKKPSNDAFAKRKNTMAGISLIETMMSLSTLYIVLFLFYSTITNVSNIVASQRYIARAIAIGNTVTEELLLYDLADPDLAIGTHSAIYSIGGVEVTSNAFFTATWVITNYTNVSGIRQIDVTVSWPERTGTKQLSWTTYRN